METRSCEFLEVEESFYLWRGSYLYFINLKVPSGGVQTTIDSFSHDDFRTLRWKVQVSMRLESINLSDTSGLPASLLVIETIPIISRYTIFPSLPTNSKHVKLFFLKKRNQPWPS